MVNIKDLNEKMVEEMDLEQLKSVCGGVEFEKESTTLYSMSCEQPGCSWRCSGSSEAEVGRQYLLHLIRHQVDPNYKV